MTFEDSSTSLYYNDDLVLQHVCFHIADLLECSSDDIYPDDNVFTELGMDSLSILSLYISLKKTFRIPEPASPEEYQLLSTPRLIASYVRSAMGGNTA